MNPVEIISAVFGVSGVFAAALFYYHLWRWARDCQQATVAIAYKRKVVMSPTLVELMLWSRKVPDGQSGQVFYRAANVTIAIVKRPYRPWWTHWHIYRNGKRPPQPSQAEAQTGTWAMKQDQAEDEAP